MSQAQVFQTFNEQLACIAQAGVPMEEGLRLIATEVRSPQMRQAIERIVHDLESGTDLSAAFAKEQGNFPELYHQVMEVGVQTGRMSQVLILFGRHLAMIQRLKRQLWQAMAYPTICLLMLLLISVFLVAGPIKVLSWMSDQNFDFGWRSSHDGVLANMPNLSTAVIWAAKFVPWICGAIVVGLILAGPAWWLAGKLRLRNALTDGFLARFPLLGGVLQRSALARWCDTIYIATDAGLDLPRAANLAGHLVGWKRIIADSWDIVVTLREGRSLRPTPGDSWRLIPPSVRVALQAGSDRHDLPNTARTLSEMYQREAESRCAALNAILSPLMLLLVAALILIVIGALISPILFFFQSAI